MANRKKRIFVFGNPLVDSDALPIKLLPKLQKRFPNVECIIADPTELLEYGKDVWILDTAEGIEKVVVLNDISKLNLPKRLSVHDYDLNVDLHLLQKLGKLQNVKIIAVPMEMEEKEALERVSEILLSHKD